MDIGHCAVTHYLRLKSLSAKEVLEDMVVTPREGAPPYILVKKRTAEFKRGREPGGWAPSWEAGDRYHAGDH